jgi:MFS family permease
LLDGRFVGGQGLVPEVVEVAAQQAQSLGIDLVDASRADSLVDDQPGVLEHLQVHGASAAEIGVVAGLYPGVWGVGQIFAGGWSDRIGRKPLIVAGMLLQAAALTFLALSDGAVGLAAAAAVLLGSGTALVYPTLIAAISDAVSPVARAPTVGVYRFWRDMGYVAGGLLAGVAADAIGYGGAIAIVAALTAISGLWVAVDLRAPARQPEPVEA